MIQPRSYQAGSKQGAYTFCFVQSQQRYMRKQVIHLLVIRLNTITLGKIIFGPLKPNNLHLESKIVEHQKPPKNPKGWSYVGRSPEGQSCETSTD